jgi:uncharacterized phage-like protein YoqJ
MIAGNDRDLQLIEDFFTKRVALLYYDFGIRKILCGVGRGTELTALNLILDQRQLYPTLKVDGVFTHEEEASNWKEKEREKLYRAIARCDEELILRPIYGSEMRFQRNIVMMDLANIVLLIGNDTETEYWAGRLLKPLIKLDPTKELMIPDIKLFRQKSPCPLVDVP